MAKQSAPVSEKQSAKQESTTKTSAKDRSDRLAAKAESKPEKAAEDKPKAD